MTEPVRARPCAICEALAPDETHVVGIYRAEAFSEHVRAAHPGFDAASAWLMPLPRRAGRRERVE